MRLAGQPSGSFYAKGGRAFLRSLIFPACYSLTTSTSELLRLPSRTTQW